MKGQQFRDGFARTSSGIKKVLLCFAIFIAAFFAIGFFWVIYDSYRCQRVPVYQTVMTDLEVVQPKAGNNDLNSARQRMFSEIIDRFEINKLQCFIFQTHNLRPFYGIYMVGEMPENADFSEYVQERHPLKHDTRLSSVLKLCEAEPLGSGECLQLSDDFLNVFFVYRNLIILSTGSANQTFLRNDAEKQAYLEQFIAPRKK